MFQSKKHRRFLMHIVGHHVQINIRQSYTATKSIEDSIGKIEQRKLYSQVGIMLGFFNHACSPNVLPVDRNGDTVYIVVRPIRAGEELFISYYGFHWDIDGENGFRDYEFKCHCERCESRQPSAYDIQRLIHDPDFRLFCYYCAKIENHQKETEMVNNLKKTCVRLLNAHGRMVWCIEICRVFCIYIQLLTDEYTGNRDIYTPGYLFNK